ncbi:MFS transporter [Rathayibacter rathayi]|uniref:MFS transporter n=1 Tax=Rathayibacter rathayi TaxID=33887 RepID=UPI000BE41661|nr:MFS transporter [Rathayibacter rathayi]AZZ49880.1 MFS transporter [Rathayibacter rathayi]MWV75951.1 MFS transporter [Rathayibacter rathayi NCPPB 2980 = VKM Ac-1601]PPG64361.1 MFS transporter [Rathayibacter rathayi]PPG74491.1 MFS transporter [Rathayibacter rathayi]PPI59291.1 MFS transporter [Rathayibacter rathayi]
MRVRSLATPALLAHAVLIQAVAFLLRPAAVYQAIQLDVPAWALGALGASFALVPLLIALPTGGLVDRVGARAVMVVGSLVAVGAVAVLLLAGGSVAGLLIGIALLGAGHLGCVVGQQTVVAGGSGGTRLDSRFGYYAFAASLGQAIGPTFIPVFAGGSVRPDPAPLFLVGGVLAVLLLAVTAGIRSPTSRGRAAEEASPGSTLGLLRVPGLARALLTSATVVAAVDLTVVYLPALGAERGLPAGVVGALLTVRALASMASRLLLGAATARLGRTRVMVGGILISALCLVLVALPAPTALLFVAVAALGLGLGIGQPITMSWLIERTPTDRHGRALALRLAGNRLGLIALPSLLGALAAAAGAGGVLIGTGAAVGATLLLLRGVRLD